MELAFDDRGDGAAVVFVHGTAAARTIWDETLEALGDWVPHDRLRPPRATARAGAPERYTRTTVEEQATTSTRC